MIAALALFATTLQDQRKPSVHGDLRIIEGFESKTLGNKRTVRVLLPPGYEQDKKERYAVLYMHDGQNLFDGMTSFIPNKEWRADETAYALMESGLIEKLIIVGIDNAGAARGDEYLPTRVGRPGNPAMGGKADLYGRFMTDELMPFITKTFRTKSGANNTGTCGSSFGGIVSLHLGLTRPNVFGRIGVFSPSLWWDDRVMVRLVKALPKKLPIRVWTDMGTAESPDAVESLQALESAMVGKGWKLGKDLACYVDEGAIHNEDAWAKRFGMMLMFLFPKR